MIDLISQIGSRGKIISLKLSGHEIYETFKYSESKVEKLANSDNYLPFIRNFKITKFQRQSALIVIPK